MRQSCARTQRIAVNAASKIFMLLGKRGKGRVNDETTNSAREIKMRAGKLRKPEMTF